MSMELAKIFFRYQLQLSKKMINLIYRDCDLQKGPGVLSSRDATAESEVTR